MFPVDHKLWSTACSHSTRHISLVLRKKHNKIKPTQQVNKTTRHKTIKQQNAMTRQQQPHHNQNNTTTTTGQQQLQNNTTTTPQQQINQNNNPTTDQ